MVELHTGLWNDVEAFDFGEGDFTQLKELFPEVAVICHRDSDSFESGTGAHYLLTWHFEASWYQRYPGLRAVFTPAAGSEWVEPDPDGRVELIHGTFHGPILRESLLGAILFMNRHMPVLLRNYRQRGWDRNLQRDSHLLQGQTVIIVGLGHIGGQCALLLHALGARVIGFKRNPARLARPLPGIDIRSVGGLDAALPEADHVVLLLPSGKETDRLLSLERLRRCRKGVFIYNFGRGNALASSDLIAAGEHIGGAFLDVVDQEPLPAASPLWDMEQVMITPHSSCVCREYKPAFVSEVIGHLKSRIA